MESLLGLAAVHWDHEPRQRVGRGVLTAPRPGGLGTARPTLWFMESPHPLPWIGSMNHWTSDGGAKAPINRTHSKRFTRGRVSGPRVSVWTACVFSAAFICGST